MADFHRIGPGEKDIDQAIAALKKGAHLLKYGRRGKPKFCPFRLSQDESKLIWYFGKDEKHLELRNITKIIPGQRTAIFQRYPRPEKEYQSFSLIYNDRSLDLICKDKDEAEIWFVGLKSLITRGTYRRFRSDCYSPDSPRIQRVSPARPGFDQGDTPRHEGIPLTRLGKAFSYIVSYTATPKSVPQLESCAYSPSSLSSGGGVDNSNGRTSAADAYRVSLSSAVSSSSQGSAQEELDSLGDVFIWGEGTGDGVLGGGVLRQPTRYHGTKIDTHLPKALKSTTVLDVQSISCGSRHAVLVTKQGETFSWGEELGGRLGHGVKSDVSNPKLIEGLSGTAVEMVACGEYHTCAVTSSGDLYTWGDGTHNPGLLGRNSEVSQWIPKQLCGVMNTIYVSYVSCGPWHTAIVTSLGQLLTCGDGSFGVLGHGDLNGVSIPKEVEALKGFRTLRVACGVWHTAAIVELVKRNSADSVPSDCFSFGKIYTWGDGDKNRLGHGDKNPRLIPEIVTDLLDVSFSQVACGNNITVGLTTLGQVYTMGSSDYGQLGDSLSDGKLPTCIGGRFSENFVEEIACGSHHVAVLTSKAEVYTWGKGSNGQLGHGDNRDRDTPTLVEFLKDKQVKNVVCGSNFTAVICLHRYISSADNLECFGCHSQFSFRRKRHNCYNCGLVFCGACSSRKSLKASLAPSTTKPYRVCDECFNKLQKIIESNERIPLVRHGSTLTSPVGLSGKDTECRTRFQSQYSRLSTFDSFNISESRNSKKVHPEDTRVFNLSNGNSSGTTSSNDNTNQRSNLLVASNSLPNPKTDSGATSPSLSKKKTIRSASSKPVLDDSKHMSEDVPYLQAQVKELSRKTKLLEAELERRTRELKEATTSAAGEAKKSQAAKEVIKSLTAQLKEMTEIMNKNRKLDKRFEEMWNKERSGMESVCSKSDSSENSSLVVNGSCSKSSTYSQIEKGECVVQDEPGVYITLSSLTTGLGNDLKRVRFRYSRKRFTEQQAKIWWAENATKVCERHNVRVSE